MNANLTCLRCTKCSTRYTPDTEHYTCPNDGGNLDAEYDYGDIMRRVHPRKIAESADRSVWHYSPLLPFTLPEPQVSTPLSTLGWSPLYRAAALERKFDVGTLWLKDDARLPSSSFKDRASSVVIAGALERGVKTICAASTGNAASSLAALCAGTGINTVIFVPRSTPEGKLAQMLVHGATVYSVAGSYDDAFELAMQASRKFGWYNRNTGVNPFTREGKKTAAYEICEQLARQSAGPRAAFRAPDAMMVPVGDGNIISGLHKGFKDLLALGWIDRLPRIVGVTAALAPALYRAWLTGTEHIESAPSATIASGISVDLPRDGVMALRAVRETGGGLVEVSDEEMLAAMVQLARVAAVFSEPASAAACAGLPKALANGWIHTHDEVVLQLTGSGLKDVRSALSAVAGQVIPIEGRIDEIITQRL